MKSKGELALSVYAPARKEHLKHKAKEYMELFINNGDYSAAYKRDCENGEYSGMEKIAVIQLADIYINHKQGNTDRETAVKRQNEILKNTYRQ